MNVDKIVRVANEKLQSKYGRGLNSIEEKIIRGFHENQTYDQIANSTNYDSNYVRQIGAKLWKSIGNACNQKVSASNFESVLSNQEPKEFKGFLPEILIEESQIITSLPQPFHLKEWRDKLKKGFIREAVYSLCKTQYFNLRRLNQGLKELYSNPYFLTLINGSNVLVSELDEHLEFGSRIGEINDYVHDIYFQDEVIRFVVGPGGIGTILIIKLLKQKGFNIELNFSFANSQNIVDTICRGDFNQVADAIALDPTSAARLRSRKSDFLPLMLLPSTSNRLTIRNNTTNFDLGIGNYVFLTDSPSTAMLYFKEIESSQSINSSRIEFEYMQADAMLPYLFENDRDVKAVTWWPYYMFHEMFGISKTINLLPERWMYDLTSLFVHESLHKNMRKALCFDIAIRDAWIDLKSNLFLIEKLVDELLVDPEYMKTLYRFNGLHVMDFTDTCYTGDNNGASIN